MEETEHSFLMGRDDVFFKFPLARALLTGSESEFGKATYLEHLFWWNKFYEDEPLKKGPEEFLTSFRELSSSVRSFGLSSDFAPLLINGEGQLVGASHRIALHLVGTQLELERAKLDFNVSERPSWDYSFSFFAEKGVAPDVVRRAALEKIGHFIEPHVPVLVVWPRARAWIEEIAIMVEQEFPSVRFRQDLELDLQGLRNLVSLSYCEESWAQKPSGTLNKTTEVREQGGVQPVSVFLLEPASPGKVHELKSRIRSIWGHEFQGVHSTDSARESIRVYSSLAFPESVAVLEAVSPSRLVGVQKRLIGALPELKDQRGAVMRLAISGSQWLDILGLRRAGDVDVLSFDDQSFRKVHSNDNTFLRKFGVDPLTTLTEPHLHWWVAGTKFVAPTIYLKVMSERAAPKDRGLIEPFIARIADLYASARVPKITLQHTKANIPSQSRGPSPWSTSEAAELLQRGYEAFSERAQVSKVVVLRKKMMMLWWRAVAAVIRLRSRLPHWVKRPLGWLKRKVTFDARHSR